MEKEININETAINTTPSLDIQLLDTKSTEITYEVVKSPEFNKEYMGLINTLDYLQTLKKQLDMRLKEVLSDQYFNTGDQTTELEDCKITYVPESMKETFDSKRFKEENPELYIQYVKISPVSASVRTTIKKK